MLIRNTVCDPHNSRHIDELDAVRHHLNPRGRKSDITGSNPTPMPIRSGDHPAHADAPDCSTHNGAVVELHRRRTPGIGIAECPGAAPAKGCDDERMLALIGLLLVVWLVFVVLGLAVKEFLWLAVIGIVLFAVTAGWGWLNRNTRT
ncbi:hypothetical protein [Rhodococcus sp. ACS1]|uniref:hypothetical protein n=1 Tax=Rhodococcus sp. ACS1 TaxID=2028570 RepID=UPI0015CE663B|nr:hypothetical protein [Rhodococcus sp. ACS1]